MPKRKDLSGQKFNMVTVLCLDWNTEQGNVWKCRCDCGNIFFVKNGYELARGKIKSCGCHYRPSLVGRKFGRLTVLSEEVPQDGCRIWKCLCECGNTINVSTKSLNSGNTKSCGCVHREIAIARSGLDLTGERFGSWVALRRDMTAQHRSRWLCKCDCGTVKSVETYSLWSGESSSCGCSRGMPNGMANLVGKRYGRLYVIRYDRTENHKVYWEYKCDCGAIITATTNALNSGNTRSCGCLSRDTASIRMTTHGHSGSRMYVLWAGMKQRCDNPNHISASSYSGIGVTYCKEWARFEPFYEWAMSNGYSDELSLDRINPFGDYTPDNCKWTTYNEQAVNKQERYLSELRYYYTNYIIDGGLDCRIRCMLEYLCTDAVMIEFMHSSLQEAANYSFETLCDCFDLYAEACVVLCKFYNAILDKTVTSVDTLVRELSRLQEQFDIMKFPSPNFLLEQYIEVYRNG